MASVTDATGHYSFPSLTPGTYNATVTAKAANASGCNGPNPYFQLGAASNLTLLGIDVAGCAGTKINMGSNTTLIEGDLAIGNSVSATIQAGSIHGKVIADPGGVYTLTKNGPNVQGGVTRASISAAVSDVTAAAARLAKLTPTQKLAAISSSVTIAGNGGVNVVTIPSLKIVNGQLTLQGSAADIFVFNVAGKFELDNSDIVLSGGVLACNVLWNFTGSAISESNEVELENGSTAAGIFLAMSRLVDLENSMLSGQVLAGGDLEVWGSTILMPAPTAAGVAYDPLTVNGIVIPPGTPVTQNFGLSVTYRWIRAKRPTPTSGWAAPRATHCSASASPGAPARPSTWVTRRRVSPVMSASEGPSTQLSRVAVFRASWWSTTAAATPSPGTAPLCRAA